MNRYSSEHVELGPSAEKAKPDIGGRVTWGLVGRPGKVSLSSPPGVQKCGSGEDAGREVFQVEGTACASAPRCAQKSQVGWRRRSGHAGGTQGQQWTGVRSSLSEVKGKRKQSPSPLTQAQRNKLPAVTQLARVRAEVRTQDPDVPLSS